MCSRPDDGDIVIRYEQRGDQGVFLLRAAPGPDQYVVHTRDAAVNQALTFAQRERVRVWMANGCSLTLLIDFRGQTIRRQMRDVSIDR